MTELFFVVMIVLFLSMLVLMARVLRGPTVYDRILAGNSFGTKIVIFLVLYGFLTERPDFVDIAILYALINFIATIAVLKFFEYGDMGMGEEEQK